MIKALRTVMIVWGAIGILFGLGYVFFPDQLGSMLGLETAPAYVVYIVASLGICFIVSCVFVIIAAVRGPLKHMMWVQFAVTLQVLLLAIDVYSLIRGFLTLSQGQVALIIDGVFTVALLALYPWRAAKQQETSPHFVQPE